MLKKGIITVLMLALATPVFAGPGWNAEQMALSTDYNVKLSVEAYVNRMSDSVYAGGATSGMMYYAACDGVNQAIRSRYPGSTYSVQYKSGTIVNGTNTYLVQNNTVIKYTSPMDNGMTFEMSFEGLTQRYKFNDGQNFALINGERLMPENTRISDIRLPVVMNAASALLRDGKGVSISENELIPLIEAWYKEEVEPYDNFGLGSACVSLMQEPVVRARFIGFVKQKQVKNNDSVNSEPKASPTKSAVSKKSKNKKAVPQKAQKPAAVVQAPAVDSENAKGQTSPADYKKICKNSGGLLNDPLGNALGSCEPGPTTYFKY